MGQAKRRGTFEERKAKAIERNRNVVFPEKDKNVVVPIRQPSKVTHSDLLKASMLAALTLK